MPEIRFYVLESEDPKARYRFACKLVEKIYRNDGYCYVQTENAEQSRLLDDLLWTFRPGSFIPHQIYEGIMPEFFPVVLVGDREAPSVRPGTLLNLSDRYP